MTDIFTWLLLLVPASAASAYLTSPESILTFVLAVLAVAERLAPRRTDTHDRPLRWRVNFFLTLLNLAAMSVLPISLVGAALWAGTRGWGLLHHVHLPAAAVIVAFGLTIVVKRASQPYIVESQDDDV